MAGVFMRSILDHPTDTFGISARLIISRFTEDGIRTETAREAARDPAARTQPITELLPSLRS
jgi:hypothetical protein